MLVFICELQKSRAGRRSEAQSAIVDALANVVSDAKGADPMLLRVSGVPRIGVVMLVSQVRLSFDGLASLERSETFCRSRSG